MEVLEKINYRGTTINKIENEFWTPNQTIVEEFNDDYIYVSNGFLSALNDRLTPVEAISVLDTNKIGEWHHLFTKNNDGTFNVKYIRFKN